MKTRDLEFHRVAVSCTLCENKPLNLWITVVTAPDGPGDAARSKGLHLTRRGRGVAHPND